jgi:hypothetical protein
MRRLGVVVIILLGTVAAASAQPLTRHGLDVRANRICAAADRAARMQPNVADVGSWLPVFTPAGQVIANATLAKLKALEAPKSVRGLWRRYRLGLRHEVNLSVQAFGLIAAGDQPASAKLLPQAVALSSADLALAKRIGTTCSK